MTITRYEHSIPPEDYRLLLEYIERELSGVSASVDSIANGERDVLHVEPKRVYEGMVVVADGANWNPDNSGRFGVYVRHGTSWVYVGGGELYGNIKFPSTQVPSADPNTLDDYEEGTWTPTITFATPGNLSVTYSIQDGRYTKIGNLVTLSFRIQTSTFTHSTASGDLHINGIPFTSGSAATHGGCLSWSGITKATYTDMECICSNSDTKLRLIASASALARSLVSAANMPTGGVVTLTGQIAYRV